MFGDLFGPSTSELLTALRALAQETLAHRSALLMLLAEKGVFAEEDAKRYELLLVRARSAVDQESAEQVDVLRTADTPEGERFRQREKIAESFNKLLGPLFEALNTPPADNKKDGKLPSDGEEQATDPKV